MVDQLRKENVKLIISLLGSNVALARKLNMDPAYISRLMNSKGDKEISIGFISKVENAFSIPRGFLEEKLRSSSDLLPYIMGGEQDKNLNQNPKMQDIESLKVVSIHSSKPNTVTLIKPILSDELKSGDIVVANKNNLLEEYEAIQISSQDKLLFIKVRNKEKPELEYLTTDEILGVKIKECPVLVSL
ncbi:hypothetical protein AKG60_26005 [Vibrio parahaemolyticus]|uniref:XRE family transcriptional regulator n=1 Tax=Vibrio parahaemolyticus TaxID=670 RepID=A0AAX0M6U8_VIBPH|nr:hypothetical protein [Vibrio vulnificus]EGQ8302499.1 hypothetical protein [Vibrio parahaemolyticus]MCS0330948.1 hypothetical protein [Vibrio diabolicus]ARN70153.1 hypothetical protein FORC36_5636 [Vibrio vulnificus]EGQ8893025.1 hypothetical protein [Vibrio parahaemolyticus]EGR3310163.1 hypothetical protein [Vibrio parahaemolyticus]